MDVEHVVNNLGGFGRYQIYITFIAYLTSLLTSQPSMQDTFINYTPDHRCYVPTCDTENTVYDEGFLNYTTEYEKKDKRWDQCKYHEMIGNTTDDVNTMWYSKFGQDKMEIQPANTRSQRRQLSSPLLLSRIASTSVAEYNFKLVEEGNCSSKSFTNDSIISCTDGWVYDDEMFQSTTAMEFDLVCSQAYITSITTTAYSIGMMIGSVIIGYIADRFGRKAGFLSGLVFFVGGGLGVAFAVNPVMLVIARGITGLGAVGTYQSAFILLVEMTPNAYRSAIGLLINGIFALGEALIGVYAIYIRRWRELQLVIVLPSIILFSYYWLMPESLRWLVSKGKHAEAKAFIEKISRVNKVDAPDCSFFDEIVQPDLKKEEKSKSVLDLLRLPNMRKRTLNMIYVWFAVNTAYYGVSQNSVNLGGNIFADFIAMMLIEIPAYLFSILIFDRVGHKGSLTLFLLIAALSCTVSGFVPAAHTTALVTLSMVGKFGAAASFGIVYVYTSEIFPTEYRSIGVGVCSMSSRLGGALAPLIASLGKDFPPLPMLIFGLLTCLSLVCMLFLPETAGIALPDTLEESENFGTEQPAWYCMCCSWRRSKEQGSEKNDSNTDGTTGI